jgi:hypothetical protein
VWDPIVSVTVGRRFPPVGSAGRWLSCTRDIRSFRAGRLDRSCANVVLGDLPSSLLHRCRPPPPRLASRRRSSPHRRPLPSILPPRLHGATAARRRAPPSSPSPSDATSQCAPTTSPYPEPPSPTTDAVVHGVPESSSSSQSEPTSTMPPRHGPSSAPSTSGPLPPTAGAGAAVRQAPRRSSPFAAPPLEVPPCCAVHPRRLRRSRSAEPPQDPCALPLRNRDAIHLPCPRSVPVADAANRSASTGFAGRRSPAPRRLAGQRRSRSRPRPSSPRSQELGAVATAGAFCDCTVAVRIL